MKQFMNVNEIINVPCRNSKEKKAEKEFIFFTIKMNIILHITRKCSIYPFITFFLPTVYIINIVTFRVRYYDKYFFLQTIYMRHSHCKTEIDNLKEIL